MNAAAKSEATTVKVTYRKSAIGYAKDQKATVAALGLRRLNHTVEHRPTGSILGMIHKVRHLVSVDGVAADTPAGMAILAAAPTTPAETAE